MTQKRAAERRSHGVVPLRWLHVSECALHFDCAAQVSDLALLVSLAAADAGTHVSEDNWPDITYPGAAQQAAVRIAVAVTRHRRPLDLRPDHPSVSDILANARLAIQHAHKPIHYCRITL